MWLNERLWLLTSKAHDRVTNIFLRKASAPCGVKTAPSSMMLPDESSTAKPTCSRGCRQLVPTCHSAANTGWVRPPNTGRGSTFLQDQGSRNLHQDSSSAASAAVPAVAASDATTAGDAAAECCCCCRSAHLLFD